MVELPDVVVEAVRSNRFSGAVRIDAGGDVVLALATGCADRRHELPNEVDTRFAIASATKGLTALVVVSLIAEGRLGLSTTARSLLGSDLPLVDDDVSVEHLLSHWSGIGDYVDESETRSINDYVLPVPVHRLDSTEAYLAVLDGHPAKTAPGTEFCYCNGGYVILALLAERASGVPFADLVRERVCAPAGMTETAFLRSDELPGRTAIGYLDVDGLRSNVLHLPVVGSGDGGLYSTVADVHRLWAAIAAGRVVSSEWVDAMVKPRSYEPTMSMRYGLGFWLHPTGRGVMLEGYDAGVSFRSVHDPDRELTWTVVSNTSDGAWPIVRAINDHAASSA